MKNKLFKALTVLLLTLTFISQGRFIIDTPYTSELGINVYSIGGDTEPFEDEDDDTTPRRP